VKVPLRAPAPPERRSRPPTPIGICCFGFDFEEGEAPFQTVPPTAIAEKLPRRRHCHCLVRNLELNRTNDLWKQKKSSFVVSYLLKPMCTKKQRTVGHAPRTKAQLTQRTHQLGKKARCRCCNCKVGGACATIGARAGIWTEACCSFLSACQIRAESVGSYAKTMVTSFPPTVCAHRLGSAVIKFW
jgi:hypothetical protein